MFGYEEGAFGAKHKAAIRKIQQADGGTLFLDEIGDMPLNLQARLLRVLQERAITPLDGKPVNVDLAVICATHHKLHDLVRAGGFREDLYYRLNGLTLLLPPLRERKDSARAGDGVGREGVRCPAPYRDLVRGPGHIRASPLARATCGRCIRLSAPRWR